MGITDTRRDGREEKRERGKGRAARAARASGARSGPGQGIVKYRTMIWAVFGLREELVNTIDYAQRG
jgi:hypothetical protein